MTNTIISTVVIAFMVMVVSVVNFGQNIHNTYDKGVVAGVESTRVVASAKCIGVVAEATKSTRAYESHSNLSSIWFTPAYEERGSPGTYPFPLC